MRNLIVLLSSVLLTGALSAQVFPRIEKSDVKERIASGKSDPESRPDPKPKPKTRRLVVDGEKVLKRYNELLDEYQKNMRTRKKDIRKQIDDLHVSVQDYFEGVFLLRLGEYKDAERKLKGVGVNVRHKSEIKTPELQKASDDIEKGVAYYFRMIAVVMQEWDDFKDEEEAKKAWKGASEKAMKVRGELNRLVKDGKAASDSNVVNLMTAWLLAGRRQWLQTWRFEKNIHEHPESQYTWQFFIAATGSKGNNMKEEYTPNYLKQRAALTVMKEFFPDAGYIKDGRCDSTLAVNYLSTGQVDQVEPCLEVKSYHTMLARTKLQQARKALNDFKALIESLKNK
jgi:hypothetical protein